MTAPETEFARLVDMLDSAQLKFNRLTTELPSEPNYEHFHRSGFHTPNEMSAYKEKLVAYEEAKAKLDSAAAEVADAAKAVDAWIPAPTHGRLKVGVSILARMPYGYASLRKIAGQYIILKGASEDEVRRNQESYIAQYGFGV